MTSLGRAPPSAHAHLCRQSWGVQRNLRGRKSVEELQPSADLPRVGTPAKGPLTAGFTLSAPCFSLTLGDSAVRAESRCFAPSYSGLVLSAGVWMWILSARVLFQCGNSSEQSSRKRHPSACLSFCVLIQRASSLRGQVFRERSTTTSLYDKNRFYGL